MFSAARDQLCVLVLRHVLSQCLIVFVTITVESDLCTVEGLHDFLHFLGNFTIFIILLVLESAFPVEPPCTLWSGLHLVYSLGGIPCLYLSSPHTQKQDVSLFKLTPLMYPLEDSYDFLHLDACRLWLHMLPESSWIIPPPQDKPNLSLWHHALHCSWRASPPSVLDPWVRGPWPALCLVSEQECGVFFVKSHQLCWVKAPPPTMTLCNVLHFSKSSVCKSRHIPRPWHLELPHRKFSGHSSA